MNKRVGSGFMTWGRNQKHMEVFFSMSGVVAPTKAPLSYYTTTSILASKAGGTHPFVFSLDYVHLIQQIITLATPVLCFNTFIRCPLSIAKNHIGSLANSTKKKKKTLGKKNHIGMAKANLPYLVPTL